MTTAAVVVAWRQREITEAALRSLAAMDPAPDRLVCVAQEFTTAELDQLRAGLSSADLTVIAVDANRGFGAGANLGIDRAVSDGAEWVLLLNNDATVASHCLQRCLEEARHHPRVSVVGPAVTFLDPPDVIWYAGGRQSHRFAFTRHRALCRPVSDLPPTGDTDYVSGCCALISSAAWREVGPFREDFFLYYEDADWCARARAAGWRCRYLGEVLCTHAVTVSSGLAGSIGVNESTAYYHARNPLRYAIDTPMFWLRWSRIAGVTIVWNSYNAWRVVRSRRLSVARSYLRGLRDAWRGRLGQDPALRPL